MALDLKDLQLEEDTRLSDYIEGHQNGHNAAPKYDTGLNTLAIVGFAPSSLRIALDTVFPNERWTPENKKFIWGLNELYKVSDVVNAHWDEWFDIHDPRSSISTRDADNVQWLSAQTKPIWMIQHYADIPSSKSYPLTDAIRYFESDYFTNTISYMIVLASMRGRQLADGPCSCEQPCIHPDQIIKKGSVIDPATAFGEIQVYGVDMAQDSEYSHQRPSCEAAIGFARGLGIKVYVPSVSDLMKIPYRYGYEGDGQALRAKIDARIGELKAQADAARAVGQNARIQTAAMVACCNEMAAIVNEAERNSMQHPVIEKLKARIAELQGEVPKANAVAEQNLMRAATLDGAHDDANYWRRSWTGS